MRQRRHGGRPVDGEVRLVRGGVRSAPPAGKGRLVLRAVRAGAKAVEDAVKCLGTWL
ncbi:MAG TPA: hypothetical protein VH120_19270 [Gemmataceae bacterium]|nr:hypothetical protein [Gemmataceae bacterium]